MAIIFNDVPSTAKASLTAVELTKEKLSAGLSIIPQKVALIGQADASLTSYTAGVPFQVFTADAVGQKCGFGSQIHLMAIKLFANCGAVDVEVFPLKEDTADVQATGSIAITATSASAGTLALYISGQYIPVSVADGATATEIGDSIAAAVNAIATSPVTASNDTLTDTVTFTAKQKGSYGNDIDISVNLGSQDALPSGVSVVITDMSGGAGEPVVSTALNNMAEDEVYTVIAHPFTDSANLTLIEDFEETRWDARVVRGFVAITAKRGDYATAVTGLTSNRNSFVSVIVGGQGIPESGAEIGAAVAGAVAKSASADPSKQYHGISLIGLTAPATSEQWGWTVRDSAVKNGCATLMVIAGGVVIDTLVNTYQTTSTGAVAPAVDTYVSTVTLLMAILYDQQQYFLSNWGSAKLATDAQIPPKGQKVMTPSTMKAELLARYDLYLERMWVEDKDSYADTIVVEIDNSNKNRLNVYSQFIIIGNLRITAIKVGYDFAN